MLEGSSKAAQADQRKKQKSNLLTAGLLVVVIVLIIGLLPSNDNDSLPLLPTLSSQQEPPSPLNPTFLIVGAYKAGTTSLLRYLESHPRVCVSNEANHFNIYGKFIKGLASYREENFGHCAGQDGVVIGEKSSRYMFHSQTPARIRKEIPQVKIIILLRNPVERLYSQWHAQNCRFKLSQEFPKFLEEDPHAKELGFYDEAVARWLHYFNRDQVLILKSEDLFESPTKVLSQVTEFLGLPKHQFSDKVLANRYGEFCGLFEKPTMDSTTRRMLEDIYRPSKVKLEALLEKSFGWF